MADGLGNGIQALAGVASNERKAGLRVALWIGAALALFQNLFGAGEGVALGVDQPLDIQGQFHIAAAIKPLASTALVGLELRKLRFPESQDVGFDFADARHVPNFEIEAVGDRGRIEGALLG